jgi:hypothetical protein
MLSLLFFARAMSCEVYCHIAWGENLYFSCAQYSEFTP